MFQRCNLHIKQKASSGMTGQFDWVEVTLLKARAGFLPYKDAIIPSSSFPGDEDNDPGRRVENQLEGWWWWGRWAPSNNSVNFQADQDYTVGTAHKDARYWAYNLTTMELHFVQRTVESGWRDPSGGAAYKVVYGLALELWGAAITNRGVIPLRGGEGGGWAKIANRILRAERVAWERV